MGDSDKPVTRYSTSEMAKDTLELVDYLGWKSPRQLHVIGVSMGGMIAQEFAMIVPERIASLSLVSSAARIVNTVVCQIRRISILLDGPAENGRDTGKTFATGSTCIPKSPDVQLDDMKGRMFSQVWLDAPDKYGEFPTNGDRFAAMELKKRQNVEGFTRKGFICQAIAAGWHYKSPGQLEVLADKVGRSRIQVLHGTLDKMITVPHGETLAKELGEEKGVTKFIVQGKGHVLQMEEKEWFHSVIEDLVEKVEKM
ncbi:MAG: hypothetical protein Q9220_001916 [cf. Caloplaca sp. 1 TL-2023]